MTIIGDRLAFLREVLKTEILLPRVSLSSLGCPDSGFFFLPTSPYLSNPTSPDILFCTKDQQLLQEGSQYPGKRHLFPSTRETIATPPLLTFLVVVTKYLINAT